MLNTFLTSYAIIITSLALVNPIKKLLTYSNSCRCGVCSNKNRLVKCE